MSDARCKNVRKFERRLALLEVGGDPNGTGSPCGGCGVPRTIFNTSVIWSTAAKTRLTFHYAVCDDCRSAKMCKRLRDNPAAKLIQMGADAAACTKGPHYDGAPLAASECTELILTLLEQQRGRCASCAHQVELSAHAGIFMASLDKVGGRYDDGSAHVLCLGCQRLFNNLDADTRAELTSAIVRSDAEPRPARPLEELPAPFESSVAAKLHQMKQRETATDRPSRGAPVELGIGAACRQLKRCGLRCVCAQIPSTPQSPRSFDRAHPALTPRDLASVTSNVPLCATPGSPFMWSDRVVAGTAYTEDTVQPVLHRYNDAKYVWEDASAREWLRGFVRAHCCAPKTALDPNVEEGAAAHRPIVVD